MQDHICAVLSEFFFAAVVEVTFSESVYTFPENVSPGTVNVEINRQIAKNLQVNVFGSEFVMHCLLADSHTHTLDRTLTHSLDH